MSEDRSGPRIPRRSALKALGAAGVSPLLPGCPQPEPPPFELSPEALREKIDTVVYVMMENRSFDHFLGARSLLEGEASDGLAEGMSNPHPEGGDVVIHPAAEACISDPPHSWSTSHAQWNEGANDGFVSTHYARHGAQAAPHVMGYFDRSTLPTLHALADSGSLCDRWFCSLLSSTWPNRFYFLAGENGGSFGNSFPEGGATFSSIFDRLDAAEIPWANYYGNVPFSVLLPGRRLVDPQYIPLEHFFADAQAGHLPAFTLIDPIFGRNDDHPPAHPLAGQILLASIYEALASSPHWERSLLLITYDEHGGFFDHVSPPTAPDARADEGFGQLGFRVPTVAVGPWVREGHVESTVYDHSSGLAFLEWLWGLEPLSERDAAAANVTEVLDIERLALGEPASPVALPVIEADEDVIYAPGCVTDFGLRDEPGPITRQPELEAFIDGLPEEVPWDRRAETDRIHADCLAEAVRLGVLRWREPGEGRG